MCLRFFVLFNLLAIIACQAPNQSEQEPFSAKIVSEKILFEADASYCVAKAAIFPIKNQLLLAGFVSNHLNSTRLFCLWDSNGVLIDSLSLNEEIADVAFLADTLGTHIGLLSENCDSFQVVFPEKSPKNPINYRDWYNLQTKHKLDTRFEAFYALNSDIKIYNLRTCLDEYKSFYIRDGLIYLIEKGSFYAQKLNSSNPYPENTYLSKGICFWDKIVYFNPTTGNLLYYSTLNYKFIFDNVFDSLSYEFLPIKINVYQKDYPMDERSFYPYPAYYDQAKQTLYFVDDASTYDNDNFQPRLRAVQFGIPETK
jgi:hypothetical protein